MLPPNLHSGAHAVAADTRPAAWHVWTVAIGSALRWCLASMRGSKGRRSTRAELPLWLLRRGLHVWTETRAVMGWRVLCQNVRISSNLRYYGRCTYETPNLDDVCQSLDVEVVPFHACDQYDPN